MSSMNKSINGLNESFGERLNQLSEEIGCSGAASIARALYQNNKCFEQVHPKGRSKKYHVNEKKDVGAIARRVQEHLTCANACDIPGNYMMAYSILFDCSLDYLYGLINEKCPNVEVLDIAHKTGFSVEAINRLMSGEEVYIDEFLQGVQHYGLLDVPGVGDYDPELDDYFLETEVSVSKFWSDLIESDLFSKLPKDWNRMACALYTSKAIKIVANDAKQEMDKLPTLEQFLSWVSTWNSLHPEEPLPTIKSMTWEEVYEKDPDFIKQVYRESRYEHYYSAAERADEYETVFWGCAGKFDRYTLDFFHKRAEEWCLSGPLPSLKAESN